MGIEKRLIEDANLTRGMQLATPERITKVIRDVLKGEVGARVKVYEQTCMRCGACAKACHFSLSHPDDASYTPVAKLDKTIFKMVRESGKLNAEQMRGIAQIAHTECNMCRRCIHYCPVGVDIAYLMSLVRRICNKLGITPTFIQDTANSHSATFNQMWVREDEWIDSLVWQEEEAREVRVVAVDGAVGAADQGVDALQPLRRRGQGRAVGHDGFFIGNGHVEAVPAAAAQEIGQLRLGLLEEGVGVVPQHGVERRGVAVAQGLAQQTAPHLRPPRCSCRGTGSPR